MQARRRSPGTPSPRLARSVLKQSRRHSASRKSARESPLLAARNENDPLALNSEIDRRARLQSHLVSKVLRDDDLALGPDTVSHTWQV